MPARSSRVALDAFPVPFAYRRDPASPSILLVHEGEAAVVRSAFHRLLGADSCAGDPFEAVAADLRGSGATAPAGAVEGWDGAVLRRVCSDARYAGVVGARGTDFVPALVSSKVFGAVARLAALIPAGPAGRAGATDGDLPGPAEVDDVKVEDPRRREPARKDVPARTVRLAPPPAARRAAPEAEDPRAVSIEALPLSSRRPVAGVHAARMAVAALAFIYTRYSTDRQEEKSEERQLDECRPYALRLGLPFEHFGDRGKSGTAMAHRPQLREMMAKVRARGGSVVIVEDLDRLSRRLPDLLALFYEMRQFGFELHDVKLGRLDLPQIVLRGYFAEEGRIRFLELSKNGKVTAIRAGKLIHKPAYGYLLDEAEKWVHHVDAVAAAIVREIFERTADGVTAGVIARDLTARGIATPTQHRHVMAGREVGRLKPWQPSTVLKIVRNAIYLGLVSHNRTKAVVDPETLARRNFEFNDEATWAVMEHPALRIVERDLFVRAALRVAELGYAAEASIARFLLTGKARCSCGSLLKACGSENATYYRCSSHMLGGACEVSDNHRLDWVERAVVAKVLEDVLEPGALKRYAQVFDQEVRKILKADIARSSTIQRRLEAIDAKLRGSLDASLTSGLASKRMALWRGDLEAEAEKLEKELHGLRRPDDFGPRLKAIERLEGDLSRILDEVPFRPLDPEGVAMATALKDAIGSVVVHPADAGGRTAVEVVVDFLADNRDRAEVGALGRVVLRTGFDGAELRSAERASKWSRNGEAAAEAADDRRYDLSDAEWRFVEPWTRGVDLETDGLSAREVVDGMVCLARAGGPLHRVPRRYGEPLAFRRALKRFVHSLGWDAARDALAAAGCGWVGEQGLGRYDTSDFPRSNRGGSAGARNVARDRKLLEAIVAREPEGSPVGLRCLFVLRVLERRPIGATALALGLTVSSAYHHWDRYKAHGVAAVDRKAPRGKAMLIDLATVAELRKVAEAGVDPDHPEADVTYPILCRVCQERFGVVYSRGGMIQLCRRFGFLLEPLVAAARRRRNEAAGIPSLPPVVPRRQLPPPRARATATPSSTKARRDAKRRSA